MHKLFALILLYASLTLTPSRASFGQAAQAKRDIQALIRQSNASLMRRDVQGTMKFCTPNFHLENIHGKLYNRTQAEHNAAKLISYARSMRGSTKVESVIIKGHTATVLTRERATVKTLAGRPPKIHTTAFDSRARGLWVKTKDGWRLKRAKQLSLTVTTDGVPKVFRPKSTK